MAADCTAAARILRDRREAIIDTFVTASRAELPAARTLDRDAIVNSLPDVLENIALMLERGETASHLGESARLGAAHGRVRAAQPAFVLDDLAVEYRILDRVVCAALRDAGELAPDVEATLRDAIYRGLGSAASELVRVRRELDAAHLADRERMLAELQASRALLEEIFEELPVGVSITDARTGRGILQNAEATRLTERDVAERLRIDDYARYGAVHPDGRPYEAADYPTARAARVGETVRDEEMLYRRRDGSVSVFSVSSRPLRDARGEIVVAITSIFDITERVEARRRIEASERAYRAAVAQMRLVADSVPIHLLHVDREERILFANGAASATWQRAPDDFIGKAIRDVIGEAAQRALAPYSARALAGETVSYENTFAAPDGTRRTFLNTYTPARGPDGEITGFVATGTDITDRKQQEQALHDSVARLHAERELRERFVAALTHDLRTPLSAARMGADLLARITDDPARVQRLAGRIADNIDRADGMIRDLLDASTLRAGETLPVDRSACNLTALVRQTLEELASIHGERFVLRAPSAVDGAWDCAGVRRQVENLCANAVKYGAAHRPITVTVSGDEGTATLEVHNEGEPIEPAELANLFEPFRRAAAARTSGRGGWGLGLALVKGIAEAHGGSVRVTSTRAAGTVFTVVLPR